MESKAEYKAEQTEEHKAVYMEECRTDSKAGFKTENSLNTVRTAGKKNRIKMWQKLALLLTMIIFSYFIILSGFMFFAFIRRGAPRAPMLSVSAVFLAMAMTISVIVISVVAHIFVNPIDNISDAMIRVADGDFSVRLKEKDKLQNIEIMNVNFNKMVKELNSTEMLKSDFITNVSHEIKTPIAAIEGYASLLLATDLDEEQKFYAKNIINSTMRISTLTGNILRLSKLENQQFSQEKRAFSLDEQIRQCILMLENSWSEKELDIEPELETVNYSGYEDLLQHVWINLITNAIKFTPKRGRILFELHKTQDGVTVSVTDNGIGMTGEELQHIFDKFYQAESNRSMAGNGLGLPLVRQIVAMHGGNVTVKSAPDMGSTFTVFLPDGENENS